MSNTYARLIKFMEAIFLPVELYVSRKFIKRQGYRLNLRNPKTFSEKIQWLKLYYNNPLLTQLADKHEAKNYVESKVGNSYVISTYKLYNNVNNIRVAELPKSFALKATHGSGWNIIESDKTNIEESYIREYFKHWLSKSYFRYSKELAYKNIKPRVLCEELIFDASGNLPEDYKIYCFGGLPKYIQIDHGRFTNHTRSFYNTKWEKLSLAIGYPQHHLTVEKPLNLNEMLEVAHKLSEGLPFLRVDLFNVDGKIYCGELTCYPGNGLEKFNTKEWDMKLGNELKLNKIK